MSQPAYAPFPDDPEARHSDAEAAEVPAAGGADPGPPDGGERDSYVVGPDRRPLAESLGQFSPLPVERRSVRRLIDAAIVAAVGAMLLVGIGLWQSDDTPSRPPTPAAADRESISPANRSRAGDSTAAEVAARDELAARPMRQFPESFMWPSELSTRQPGEPILLPRPSRIGEAGVPTGFPHSPEGAMAQMAAIFESGMESGTLAGARTVLRHWAVPDDEPATTNRSGAAGMATLLSELQLPASGSDDLHIDVTPAMGLIKGTAGSDFVIPCVNFGFEVTLEDTLRFGTAACVRMVWVGDRWMIGPGSQPADAPALWPGTDAAYDVGYRDLLTSA